MILIFENMKYLKLKFSDIKKIGVGDVVSVVGVGDVVVEGVECDLPWSLPLVSLCVRGQEESPAWCPVQRQPARGDHHTITPSRQSCLSSVTVTQYLGGTQFLCQLSAGSALHPLPGHQCVVYCLIIKSYQFSSS